MLRIFRSRLTKEEYLEKLFYRELRRVSKGKMPKEHCRYLAKRTVARLDFTNSYQMHKSIQGYADLLYVNYQKKICSRED